MSNFPIQIKKDKLVRFCKKHHIIYLAFFGSILTPSFTKKSDVDILVKFEKKHIPHLFGLIGMELELSEMIGRSVDLKTPNSTLQIFSNFEVDFVEQQRSIKGEK